MFALRVRPWATEPLPELWPAPVFSLVDQQGRAFGSDDFKGTRGLFKVVADARTDQVLGVHVFAEYAGDVIYAGVLAVRFHLTVKDLADTFAPYLTMSEGLKLSAQSFERDPAKLSCCAA